MLCVSRRAIAFIVENGYSTAGSRMETYTERVKRYVRDGLRLKKRNETRREKEREKERRRERRERREGGGENDRGAANDS